MCPACLASSAAIVAGAGAAKVLAVARLAIAVVRLAVIALAITAALTVAAAFAVAAALAEAATLVVTATLAVATLAVSRLPVSILAGVRPAGPVVIALPEISVARIAAGRATFFAGVAIPLARGTIVIIVPRAA